MAKNPKGPYAPEHAPAKVQPEGVHVMTLGGRIVLYARPGETPTTPTVKSVEQVVSAALEMAGYAPSVELVRTDQ